MKNILLFFSLMGCMVTLCAQEPTKPVTDTSQMAKIVFEKTLYDYGTITKGSEGICTFTFTNKGKVPLLLSKIQAGCNCTTASWSWESVSPGKTGEIKVKYNTNNPGPFHKSITVTSNAVNPTVVLQIKGEVK
jgi:hypothetical protein